MYGLDLIASVQGSTATYYLADRAAAVTGAYSYDYDIPGNQTLRRIQSRGADTFGSTALSANQMIPLPH